MSALRIGAGFELPLDAITQTIGILAKKRVGKSHTAWVMVEEMIKNHLPVVVCDPIGNWWGLRSSFDGKNPGLPVIILGGDHADVPIEPTDGTTVADLVIDHPAAYIIDLSLFSKTKARSFMTDFLERLYHKNRDPVHVVLDEADEWAPQRAVRGGERLLGACNDLVRRGGARGLGVTMITQRPAVLNNDVLTQIEVLVILRVIAPPDRKALDEWIKVHGTPEQRTELLESLASLPIGTAWFWSPGWLDIFQRVEVRQRETFDSTKTPEHGKRAGAPTAYAEVDLSALTERLAATIERAAADDPKILRREIAELKKKLAAAEANHQEPASTPEPVEVPVPFVPETITMWIDGARSEMQQAQERLESAVAKVVAAASAAAEVDIDERLAGVSAAVPAPEPKRAPSPPASPGPSRGPGDGNLGGPHRKILTALAVYGASSKARLAALCGYSAKGGGFNNPLSSLRTSEYITRGEPIKITRDGLIALGDYEPLPSGPALLDQWCNQLSGPERKILRVIASRWPDGWEKDILAAECGYSPVGGGFNNPLSRLRTLGLVAKGTPIRLTDDFGEAISG